jgi:thiol-disulfide isomerase/thioredoxin
MKKLFTLAVALTALTSAMAQGIAFEPEGTTLEQASVKAKAEKKLIFLDAYTQWCGPCKKMAREVFPLAEVGAAMNDKFVSLQIDMESAYGAPLAKRLQVTAYPTFIIFNADAKEIGRFLGGSNAEEFLKKIREKSQDNSSARLQARWEAGERDPQFLTDYLATLSAAYKVDEANDVAEALLKGKAETFAADSALRVVFMRHINNPFASSFVYTVKNPDVLAGYLGNRMPVDMKTRNVLTNYQRQLIAEKEDGTATLDEPAFRKFTDLLKELNIADADHYRLQTLITLAEKQKDLKSYIGYIKEYLNNPALDAGDMQLANWAKPFAGTGDEAKPYREEMKKMLRQRVDDIKKGKRQAQTTIGNMRLSRPTDELLLMVIDALDGKMPQQH